MRQQRGGMFAAMALAVMASAGLAGADASLPGASASKATRLDGTKSTPAKAAERPSIRALFNGAGSGSSGRQRPTGRGWSVATDRRRATKARNVARNRKAHK